MADSELSWEIGSNFSVAIGLVGLEALRARWVALNEGVQLRVIPRVLRAGAEVMRQKLQDATPSGREFYTYPRKSKGLAAAWPIRVKSKRAVGQARANVIIYERKARGVLAQGAMEQSLLIGYRKEKAWYMYWYEYGRKGQAAKPFARAVFDSSQGEALAAMDAEHQAAIAAEDHL